MELLKRLSLSATILAFCLVVLGAYVRLSDAGLGCPDWPGCFGNLAVPQNELAINEAKESFLVDHIDNGKAWKEMIHRYVAGLLGPLIFLVSILTYKNIKKIKLSPLAPIGLILILFFQVFLGMWTVTLLLKPIIVTMHLIFGMSILGLLTLIAHRSWGEHSNITIKNNEYLFIRFSLFLLLIQIFLGGWTSTNYAGLACTDFPTCNGEFIPKLDFTNAFNLLRDLGKSSDGLSLKINAYETIQWVHRVMAILVTVFFIYIAKIAMMYSELRFLAFILLITILIQFIVGISNVLLHLPVLLAVIHNLGAASLVIIIVVLNSKVTKIK